MMLYCGQDQWGPEFHIEDLLNLQSKNLIPSSISVNYMPDLRHDFVSSNRMVSKALDWCYNSTQNAILQERSNSVPHSRL